jgi:hypothetical protein
MKEALFLRSVAVVVLSIACTERTPTRPDATSGSGVTREEGGIATQPSRSAPREVAPRKTLGPLIRLLRIGNWGSAQSSGLDNRLLTVTRTGALLRSECSNGVIDGVISLDAAGHFDVLGTYQIQAGPVGLPRPARYVGFAIGETLTFTVVVTAGGQAFGPFTLTFGQAPQIGYCPIV